MAGYSKLLDQILDLALIDDTEIDDAALTTAKLSFYDWLVVSCAGSSEPVADIIRDFVASEGGSSSATVVGLAKKIPARAAALANGTISHALDYDDTHFAYVGHPSVAIFPAALAVGEEIDASAGEVVRAFLLGAEVACRIGMVLGRRHYDHGFHQTATSGCFGATVAVARLYGLDRGELRNAIGLAATRSSGLKSQFGTMGKPYNAGSAASNAVEVCGLASRGFSSSYDGLGGAQGFLQSHQPQHDTSDLILHNDKLYKFIFTEVRHKLHACCHGTHSMIEGLLKLMAAHGVTANNLDRLTVTVNPRWMSVCDIKEPLTGLELKFSFVFLAAMVLHKIDTSAFQSFSREMCENVELKATAGRINVNDDETLSDGAVHLSAEIRSQKRYMVDYDLMTPFDTNLLGSRLLAKATAILGKDKANNLWASMSRLDELSATEVAHHLRP